MTTLSRRATPAQARILRAVAGAVRNVQHAHPDWIADPRAAGSIAKRATGTLTSQGGALAALITPSERAERLPLGPLRQQSAQMGTPAADVLAVEASKARGHTLDGRAPDALRTAHGALGSLAHEARKRGDMAYLAGLEDAMRVIGWLRVEQ